MATVANPIYDTVFKYLMEDEYYSAIENRDTAIMLRDEKIAEQSNQLAEQKNLLAEKDNKILTSARMMKEAGISESAIAAATGLSAADITAL